MEQAQKNLRVRGDVLRVYETNVRLRM
jgi:hypothetical protein